MQSATESSSARAELLALAQRLAGACPPKLGREIIATGSVGAGLADANSDLELLLLVDDVPDVQDVTGWLERVGATDVLAGAERAGVWAWCRVDGIEVEPYWGSLANARTEVEELASGTVVEHKRLAFGHVLTHSLPLRTDGGYAELAARVAVYPEDLTRRVVELAVSGWEIPSPRLGSVLRGDRVAVEGFLMHEVQQVLRIVFALNRRWELPRWKWLAHYALGLEIAPDDLVDRAVAPLVEPDSLHAARLALELVRDTLALVPAALDVSPARRGIAQRLTALEAAA